MSTSRTYRSVALAVFVTSCAAPRPAALVAPDLNVTLSHRPGGLLAETQVVPKPQSPAQVWGVQARGFVLASASNAALLASAAGVSRSATLLLEPATGDPIRGVVDEVVGLRFAVDEDAVAIARELSAVLGDPSRALEFTTLRGTLAEGTSTELTALAPDGTAFAFTFDRHGDTADGGRVALRHRVGGTDDGFVLLGTPVGPTSGPLWVELPGRAREATGFLIELVQGDANDGAHALAVEASWVELESSVTQLAKRTSTWTEADASLAARRTAVAALGNPDERRDALRVLINDRPGVAMDLLATMPDTLADAWIAGLTPKLDVENGSAVETAWTVERSAIEVLASRIDKGLADVQCEGLMTRHLGEMGRFALDVLRKLQGDGTRADFEAWIQEENVRLLASPDPAARIRALDWLAVRGMAPETFDPFADRSERREQLQAFELKGEAAEVRPEVGEVD